MLCPENISRSSDKPSELEYMREKILDERDYAKERLIDSLEDLSVFQQGRWIGELQGYEKILSSIRSIEKYGVPDYKYKPPQDSENSECL